MTVRELMDELLYISGAYGGDDVEIRIGSQPNYPMQEILTGNWATTEEMIDNRDEEAPIVWFSVVQSYDSPYLPGEVNDKLKEQGWS